MISEQSSFRQSYAYDKIQEVFNQTNQGHFSIEQLDNIGRNCTNKLQKDDQNSFYFKMRVTRKVAKFIEKLKAAIVLSQPALKPEQRFYLEDQYQYDQHQQEDSLIPYQNPLRIFFEIFFSVAIIFCFWKHTYQLSFGKLLFQNIGFEAFLLAMVCLHIILFHNNQHRNQKLERISNRKIIFKQYVSSNMPLDIIISIGLIIQISGIDRNIGVLFAISRIITLPLFVYVFQIWRKMFNIFATSTERQSVFGIIKFFSQIFVVIHILAIIFVMMSQFQKDRGVSHTWVEASEIPTQSDFDIYILAWYWGCTIISTVGFGDLAPGTMFQRIIVSFIQVFCCIAFGYFVSYIGALIGMLGQSKAEYQKDIRSLNLYLKQVLISNNLKNEIRSHFFNRYLIQQKYSSNSEAQIRQKCTQKIRNDVDQQNNKQILRSSQKISSIFSQNLVSKLALNLVKRIYAPQDTVYDPLKFQNDTRIWILQQGQINQYIGHQFQVQKGSNSNNYSISKPVAKYNHSNRNTIGWQNFISGKKYANIAKAVNFSVAYQLSRADLEKALYDQPKDRNQNRLKFCEQREKILLKSFFYDKVCLACKKMSHDVIQCSRIHFRPQIMHKIINQSNINSTKKVSQKKKYVRVRQRYNWKRSFISIGQTVLDFVVRQSRSSLMQGNIRRSIFDSNRQNNNLKMFSNNLNSKSGDMFSSNFFGGLAEKIKFNKKDSFDSYKGINSGRQQLVISDKGLEQPVKKQIREDMFDQIFWQGEKYYFPRSNQRQIIAQYNLLLLQNQRKRNYEKTKKVNEKFSSTLN